MKVFAHRGCRGRYPENTMRAFAEAEKLAVDGIELDVQLTKDGEVVIIHDETVDRTTDGTGWVRDYTLEDLKKLDAGRVQSGRYGFCPIPSLDEYCAWVKGTDMITNIEIKSGVYYYEELEEKTLALVKKYGLERKVFFSSFNPSSVSLLRRLAPDIPCGALVDREGIANAGYYCRKHDFAFYHPGLTGLTDEAAESCRRYGIGINVWTVNDMAALERTYELGCAGIFSDYPGVAKAWVEKQK